MSKPVAIRQSSGLLRRLLFSSWLGSSLLIVVFFALVDVVEHQKKVVKEADQITQLVSASLRAPLTTQQRQQLLEAYGRSNRAQRSPHCQQSCPLGLTRPPGGPTDDHATAL